MTTYPVPKTPKPERTRKRMQRRPHLAQTHTKPYRFRWPEYLEFVGSRPCVVTGQRPVEVCHFGPKGYGSKAHDWCVLPLKPELHRIQGRMTIEAFGELMHFNPYRAAFTLLTEYLEKCFRKRGLREF